MTPDVSADPTEFIYSCENRSFFLQLESLATKAVDEIAALLLLLRCHGGIRGPCVDVFLRWGSRQMAQTRVQRDLLFGERNEFSTRI